MNRRLSLFNVTSLVIGSDGGRAIGVSAVVIDFVAIERLRRRVEQEFGPVGSLRRWKRLS